MPTLTTTADTKRTGPQASADLERVQKPSKTLAAFQTVVVLAIVIAGLELAFQAAGLGQEEYLDRSAELGWEPVPNRNFAWRTEGFSHVHMNKWGMRNAEVAMKKPPGVIRVAVIGDSFVESLQVENENTFCALVQQQLRKKYPGQPVEVLNFGVSAYNLGQMYLKLKQQVLAFEPDLVLLTVRPDSTQVVSANPKSEFFNARPYIFTDGKGGLITDRTIQKRWEKSAAARRITLTSWLRHNSCIYGVMGHTYLLAVNWKDSITSGKLKWGAEVTTKSTAFAEENAKPTYRFVNMAKRGKDEQANKDKYNNWIWPSAHAVIEQMQKESKSHNARFALLRLSFDFDSDRSETELLKRTAKQLKIPLLDATPILTADSSHQGKPLFLLVHLSETGHRLVAQALAPFIASATGLQGPEDRPATSQAGGTL